ncbi:MAG: hypothetical protein JST30_02360 [Armatimonadetes bacterium]|nr:hypothetical protein [Armatimonadota bacterium]
MLSAVLLATLKGQTDASDYFPLTKGVSWTYEVSGSGTSTRYVDSVGNTQTIDGQDATPIVSKVGAKVDGSTFYRVTADTVYVVAFEQNKPLGSPYPILKFGSGSNDWTFDGETQWLGTSAPLSMKGRVKKIGQRDVLGTKRDAIEVTIDAIIGAKDQPNLKSSQVYVYARGIGLVEMKDTMKVKDVKQVTVKKLVAYSGGNG